jgi:hypothetical protein
VYTYIAKRRVGAAAAANEAGHPAEGARAAAE